MKPMLLLVGAVIILSLGFLGGTVYQKNQQPSGSLGRRSSNFQSNGVAPSNEESVPPIQQGAGPVSGSVISKDQTTVTIQLSDGSTKIIVYSDDTQINKLSAGTLADVQTGEKITVMGSTNTDGTVTARTISIGGQIMGGNRPDEQKQL
ncbi:MAG: hypothetical protein NUV52_03070 [Candidatus Roizmanbacteria bacterium]|nr:hypothetical protein [Candidatus Roizmanbacteria bacterium]